MSRGWVLLSPLLGAPRVLAGTPVFIDFSEDPKVPQMKMDDDERRALARQLVKARGVHLREEECQDDSNPRSVVSFIQSIQAPAATEDHSQLLHTVRVRDCASGNPRWGERLLVLPERGRVMTKVKADFADRFVKTFRLDPDGPAGVFIAFGETFQSYTISSAAVYALEKAELRELQNLHFVQSDSCGEPYSSWQDGGGRIHGSLLRLPVVPRDGLAVRCALVRPRGGGGALTRAASVS